MYTYEFHALQIVLNIRMRILFLSHVACMGELGNPYIVLVGRSEGKRPPGYAGCRWEDKIKMKLNHLGWMMWTGLSCLGKTSIIPSCHQQ
jgi:hypothetical protein